MSEASKLQTIDFEARSHQILSQEPLLSARDVEVTFSLRGNKLTAIRRTSLDLYEGETLAIVGESGSGKSVFTKCFVGMLDKNGSITNGSIMYQGEDLAQFSEKDWLRIRGRKIAMVTQDPMTSLNPLKTIGYQIQESVELHQGLKGHAAKQEVLRILEAVGIPDSERRYKQYPHEFSGGMRQRVVIAIAVACRPQILICDEPTTALDVTIQAQIIELMNSLKEKLNTAIVLITHDLGVVANMAQRIYVMYAGKIVERGSAKDIFYRPKHPYTWGLLASVPRLDAEQDRDFRYIPGTPPDLLNPPKGCPFAARCRYACRACVTDMPEETAFDTQDHRASCWLYHPGAEALLAAAQRERGNQP